MDEIRFELNPETPRIFEPPGLTLTTIRAGDILFANEYFVSEVWDGSSPRLFVTGGKIEEPRVRSVEGSVELAPGGELGTAVLRSDAAGGYGAVEFAIPEGLTMKSIDELSIDFMAQTGGVGGGSPRFSIEMGNKTVFVALGTPPNFDDPVGDWSSTGNLPDDTTALRCDASAFEGGSAAMKWADACNVAGDAAITAIWLVVDGGWKFPASGQTIGARGIDIATAATGIDLTRQNAIWDGAVVVAAPLFTKPSGPALFLEDNPISVYVAPPGSEVGSVIVDLLIQRQPVTVTDPDEVLLGKLADAAIEGYGQGLVAWQLTDLGWPEPVAPIIPFEEQKAWKNAYTMGRMASFADRGRVSALPGLTTPGTPG